VHDGRVHEDSGSGHGTNPVNIAEKKIPLQMNLWHTTTTKSGPSHPP